MAMKGIYFQHFLKIFFFSIYLKGDSERKQIIYKLLEEVSRDL